MLGLVGIEVLIALIVWHYLADFPLQGDFLSAAKNRHSTPYPDVPWQYAMLAHCLIHASGVWVITDSILLAVVEGAVHYVIDTYRCNRRYSFVTDQVLHLLCKWALFIMYMCAVIWSTY